MTFETKQENAMIESMATAIMHGKDFAAGDEFSYDWKDGSEGRDSWTRTTDHVTAANLAAAEKLAAELLAPYASMRTPLSPQ